MQKRVVKAGRPSGTTTFEPKVAKAFGAVVREARKEAGFSQEAFASAVDVERSHMGKVERGEHLPNLILVYRIAFTLNVEPGSLVDLAWKASLE